MVSAPTLMPSPTLLTVAGQPPVDGVVLQQVRHRLERAEVVDGDEIDVGPDCLAARKKLRPMRPKPLMPTRTVIVPAFVASSSGPRLDPTRDRAETRGSA